MREATLVLHLVGMGLLTATLTGGFFLNRAYRKAPDLPSKATILKAARPLGILSPVAMLIMIITGVGNMHALGVGLYDLGWLSAKVAFFAVAVVAGVTLGILARKRGSLVAAMAQGRGGDGADSRLAAQDTMIGVGYLIMAALMLAILYLSVVGRLGGQ